METTTSSPTKVYYTAQTHTTGGREQGVSRSSDGNLDIRLNTPGTGGTGTNPEQLFAAGWSACFLHSGQDGQVPSCPLRFLSPLPQRIAPPDTHRTIGNAFRGL